MKRSLAFAITRLKSVWSFSLCLLLSVAGSANAAPLVYEGAEGPGKGKHIVFLAGDHEYRSEETLPELARILAKHHGFKCTVLFNIDPETGEIVAGNSNMPGLEALDTADLAFLHTVVPPAKDYAVGWVVTQRPWANGVALMHNGTNTMNHAVMWLAPKRKFAVVVMCNINDAKACDEVASNLIGRFLEM